MKIHKVLLIVLGVLALGLAQTAAAQPVRPDTMYAESHALLVGVSDYTNGWRDLRGVKQDIPDVQHALEDHDFSVQVVWNPTGAELREAYQSFIAQYGRSYDNRLLFYFAGHGYTTTLADGRKMGYLVPTDAPRPDTAPVEFERLALDMQMIEVYAKRIQSKHAVFLFDSCFAGTIFHATRGTPELISYKTAKPVRQFITSGSADEEVQDQSLFRKYFVAALRGEGGDANGDGYITAAELGLFLDDQVVKYSKNTQHPQYGKIIDENLDKGDVVFMLPKIPTPSVPTPLPSGELLALADLEEAFLLAQAQEGRMISAATKVAFWQQVLAHCAVDLASTTRDNDLCRQAQERLRYWPNVTPTPAPEPTPTPQPLVVKQPLRTQPGTYSVDEIEQMVKAKGFRDSNWNPQGDFPNAYEAQTLNGDKVVIDHASGLMWQQGGSPNYMVWSKAQEYVDQLNHDRFAGFSDWRLPTIEELASLLEPTEKNDDLYIDPKFDTRQRWCWSSDKRSSESAWLVFFYRGSVDYDVYDGSYVRAVRSWP